jgi:carboxymethylenebutenolidase
MAAQTVALGQSGQFKGYLAIPRSGSGPGLVLLHEIFGLNRYIRELAELYAEEGYVVLAPDLYWQLETSAELGYAPEDISRAAQLGERLNRDQALKDVAAALEFVRAHPAHEGKTGVLGFGLGGGIAWSAAARLDVDVAAIYYGVALDQSLDHEGSPRCPVALHFAAEDRSVTAPAREAIRSALAGRDDAEIYVYPEAEHGFANWQRDLYNRAAASLAHSRTIGIFRRVLGPRYDLDALWESHTSCEFERRDVDATMATMVAEPYVNHVPTMTGGYGYQDLRRFYATHFIPRLPKDTRVVTISRTVGADRVVDELLLCFTHDTEVDFLLPGVKPTGRYVEIPTVAVVQFRGDKIFNEHIYWDQATALVQLGLLEPAGLPVAGIETARKLRDEKLAFNTLIKR